MCDPVKFLLEKLNDNPKYKVTYECSRCGRTFNSETPCDEHVKVCIPDKLPDTSTGNSTEIRKKTKRKQVDDVKSKSADVPGLYITSDVIPAKQLKENDKMHLNLSVDSILENNYEISSEIINENEVLITLSYNGNKNNTSTTSRNTPEKSLKELTDTESGHVKVLTVLNPVISDKVVVPNVPEYTRDLDKNASHLDVIENCSENDQHQQDIIMLNPVISDEIIIPTNVPEYKQELERNAADLETNQNFAKEEDQSQQKNKKTKRSKNSQKEIKPEKEKYPVNQRLYKKIPRKAVSGPSNMGVYDFFDEEEEKLKQQKMEEKERLRDLKRRTCSFCNKVFDDPMDVLRHKREAHQFSKVVLTKEEIQPYYDTKNKTECPLCFKPLDKRGQKALFIKHLITHCDDYTFKCRVCGLQFRRKDHWLNHEERHVVRPT